MAGLGIALRGLGKALGKIAKKKKKKADEGLKKLKNIVPHVEYIRSKKKSK